MDDPPDTGVESGVEDALRGAHVRILHRGTFVRSDTDSIRTRGMDRAIGAGHGGREASPVGQVLGDEPGRRRQQVGRSLRIPDEPDDLVAEHVKPADDGADR